MLLAICYAGQAYGSQRKSFPAHLHQYSARVPNTQAFVSQSFMLGINACFLENRGYLLLIRPTQIQDNLSMKYRCRVLVNPEREVMEWPR